MSDLIKTTKMASWRRALPFIVLSLVAGVVVVVYSLAAGSLAVFEVESGTLGAGATIQSVTGASGGQGVKFGAGSTVDCTVDAKLVNSCRPWLGVTVAHYPNIGDTGGYNYSIQVPYFNKRLNDPDSLNDPTKAVAITKKAEFIHVYTSGAHQLSTYEKSVINSPDQYLQMNWKPNANFYEADGRNATVNSAIDTVANSIKSVTPKKIMLAVYHEPEDNVTSGSAGSCSTSSGSAGSPTDYVNMWKNVRQRFDNLGVTNVVWTLNYMGFSNYDCMIPMLWPGNELVDWVLWDPYAGGSTSYLTAMKRFYTWMENNSNATHDYVSKPWGFGEFGYWNKDGNSTDANAVIFWQQAKQALINNSMPRLKLFSVYDSSPSTPPTYDKSSFLGLKINTTPTPDIAEQTTFNDFAQTLLNLKQ